MQKKNQRYCKVVCGVVWLYRVKYVLGDVGFWGRLRVNHNYKYVCVCVHIWTSCNLCQTTRPELEAVEPSADPRAGRVADTEEEGRIRKMILDGQYKCFEKMNRDPAYNQTGTGRRGGVLHKSAWLPLQRGEWNPADGPSRQ